MLHSFDPLTRILSLRPPSAPHEVHPHSLAATAVRASRASPSHHAPASLLFEALLVTLCSPCAHMYGPALRDIELHAAVHAVAAFDAHDKA